MEQHTPEPTNNCKSCFNAKTYTTGRDEYPPCTTLGYCSKGHWENGDVPTESELQKWDNCPDFQIQLDEDINLISTLKAENERLKAEKAKEAKLFAEAIAKAGFVWKEFAGGFAYWFHKDDGFLSDGYDTESLYNSEAFKEIRENNK